ncbi:MAG: ABC transporter permease [Candidatus Eremiobacteraeota bacterium]|nr:ABC transporter permease [Candidatus Eremiobacteraeota bacterium]MBC5802022.1 ABC transporter permease [Candidatus Eremiobacteraeota bacterium]MBC5822574.1 ABC transporter permease [Candidatus Eremiobacteraeota bacterium]
MTRFWAYAREAFEAIWRNRARSMLTMLGMIIGTASVIAVLGIGKAASGGISGTLNSLGNPGFFVSVDPEQDDPAAAAIQYRDAALVAADDADIVAHVFPTYQRNFHIVANGTDYIGTAVSQTDYIVDSLQLREGRRIDSSDVATAARVCLLGEPMERRFFGSGQALGATVRIDGTRFRVIGVYSDATSSIFSSAGGTDYAEMPYSTFHELVPGPVDSLNLYAQPGKTLDDVRTAVVATLRHAHGPHAAYQVQDALAFEGAFIKTIGVVGIGLTAIGGVALLVAGIGVMNIMLVSVTERTREIGIRKAIGGSRRDIVLQFLMEAVILSLIGGGLGMLLGIAIVLLAYGVVSGLLGPAPIPWLIIVATAAGFSTFVGVIFGTYPAMRAGKMDPIQALRS